MTKKLLFIILLFIVQPHICSAENFINYGYSFSGKWYPAENPLLMEDNGIQDIQNMRRFSQGLRGVSGHTLINSTVWNSTYKYPANIFQFKKDNPSENHVIIAGADSSSANCRLYLNDTAIPSAGDFSATALYTPNSSATSHRFSMAPQGHMVYANGYETLIWGGDETDCLGFDVYDPSGSFLYDYGDIINNTLTSAANVASMVPSGASDSYTVLLLHCNGADSSTTFTDNSSLGNTMTAKGSAQLDTAYKVFGSASGLLDGVDSAVTTTDSASWFFSDEAFTIDCWIKLDSLSNQACIASQVSGDTNYWEFYVDTDGSLVFDNVAAGSSSITITSSAGSIVAGAEYHIALQRNDTDEWSIFVNGLLVGAGTDADSVNNLTGGLSIGGLYISAPEDFLDGWMDEIRISKGIARFASSFEVPIIEYSGSGTVYLRIASPRPLDGFKMYVSNPNASAGTMTAYYWNGSDWTLVSDLSDGTASGGASLAQTGSVSFTSTVGFASKSIINFTEAYWYKVEISVCDDTATVYKCSLSTPMQTVTNIWDGDYYYASAVYSYDNNAYNDYTIYMQSNDSSTVMPLDSLTAGSEYVILGFVSPMQGVNLSIVPNKGNGTVSTLTASYWNGSGWVSLSPMDDGTAKNGASLAKTGSITWEHPGASQEHKTVIELEEPLYYYKLQWSANLDGETEVFYATGIPAIVDEIGNYSFSHEYQERLFLLDETSGSRNRALYSAYNAPFVFNGTDSGSLYFGGDERLTAACTIYNVFQTTGYYQMLVTKENETYRVFGDGPENWEVNKMSGNIGCIAPLSMAVCDVADITESTQRHVAIWQAASGIYMCDGATINNISAPIANYFDDTDPDYIPEDKQSKSVGWYDPDLKAYKLLIYSGATATERNVELEYSLLYQSWTKLYRENGSGANPLQVGAYVKDTSGNVYQYGATNEGYVYRLENGNTWNGTNISGYIQTKDLLLSTQFPAWHDTTVRYMRLLYVDKSDSDLYVSVSHYGDNALTTSGTVNQKLISDIAMDSGPFNTQSCILGPNLSHSFKFSFDSGVTNGAELLGFSLYFDEYDRIYNH